MRTDTERIAAQEESDRMVERRIRDDAHEQPVKPSQREDSDIPPVYIVLAKVQTIKPPDGSKLTDLQLADRIRQIESKIQETRAFGTHNKGHRQRAEKLASYRAELAERQANADRHAAAPAAPETVLPAIPGPLPAEGRRNGHSRKRYNNDTELAEYPHGKLTSLDRAVEEMLANVSLGDLLDAAWAASARLHPRGRA
jgi:hypothetical protein